MQDFQSYNDGEDKLFPEILKARGLSKVQAILDQFENDTDLQSQIAASHIAESHLDSDHTYAYGRSRVDTKKTMGSINKAKFLELIDFSKNIIGDLREQEEMKESHYTRFYKERDSGELRGQQPSELKEEQKEGEDEANVQ